MIKEPISGYLECLQDAEIHHSLFISRDKCELHLWDVNRFEDTLNLLNDRGVIPDSIVKGGDEDFFYFIRF